MSITSLLFYTTQLSQLIPGKYSLLLRAQDYEISVMWIIRHRAAHVLFMFNLHA